MYLVPLSDSDFDSLFRSFNVKEIIVINIFHNCAKCWQADVFVCFVFFGSKGILNFWDEDKNEFSETKDIIEFIEMCFICQEN